MQDNKILSLKNVTKSFVQGAQKTSVLSGVNLDIAQGECVSLIGASGAGKTTLLHMAGLLDTPTSGQVLLEGENSSILSQQKLTQLRRDKIGFVYQFHHLLSEFTALENVMFPNLIGRKSVAVATKNATELLDKVGLASRIGHYPSQLSGGERQRVAIARALANKPVLLLADEPTGNLDEQTAEHVSDLLLSLVTEDQLAALIVTHNQQLAQKTGRICHLKKGCLA